MGSASIKTSLRQVLVFVKAQVLSDSRIILHELVPLRTFGMPHVTYIVWVDQWFDWEWKELTEGSWMNVMQK